MAIHRVQVMIAKTGMVTADDLLHLKDDGCRYELIEGALKKMSPAGSEHGRIAMRIGRRLAAYVEEHELGEAFAAETGFRIATDPDTVRAPDAAFVSSEKLASVEPTSGYLPLAPDLLVEVVSPSDTFSDVESKVLDWLRAGTKIVIVADPATCTLRVYRDSSAIELLGENDVLELQDVLPGWTLGVGDALGRD